MNLNFFHLPQAAMTAPSRPCRPSRLAVLAAACWALAVPAAQAAEKPAPAARALNSAMDAPLFYELLIGEVEFHSGQASNGFELMLNAARRTRDQGLYRRAAEMAMRSHSADRVVQATKAWRTAYPQATEPVRMQAQVLLALRRLSEAAEPTKALLALLPEAERVQLLPNLPAWLQRQADPQQAQAFVEQAARPYLDVPATRTAAQVAMGRAAAMAGQNAQAVTWARQAQAGAPGSPLPAILALELLREQPLAEDIIATHLARPDASVEVRLAYARALAIQQRHALAVAQFEKVLSAKPDLAGAWLSLGALHLEQKQPALARQALDRFIALASRKPDVRADARGDAQGNGDDADTEADASRQGLNQAYLMQAQAAEQLGDVTTAEQWLARVSDAQRALELQVRRAGLLARQGRLAEARAMIRATPEGSAEESRGKWLAEAQLLRDARQWQAALEVLKEGGRQHPEDLDIIYEQAMVAEKLGDLAQMEALLRRIIAARPDHAHAHNALGYSLAERNVQLPEARRLIQRALEISPKDPFITDSLGWVEYRLGNLPEAARLLREAWAARPDTEIGTHLGEVLWALGERDEARRIWREARGRDAGNDILRETLARLKVDL